MRPKRGQSGYLLEVPLIVMAVAVVLTVLLPMLPKVVGKVLAVAGSVAIIGGLYYMIVIPGWQPGDASRLRWPWNLLVFLTIASLIILATVGYVLKG
jgi:hypothetical protein